MEGFRGLLIVRHPFDRYFPYGSFDASSVLPFSSVDVSFRLVSAFRDKLERCHRSDCVLDNDWSVRRMKNEDGRFHHLEMSLMIPGPRGVADDIF